MGSFDAKNRRRKYHAWAPLNGLKKLTDIDKNDPGGTSKSANNWREISEPASRKSAIQVTTGGFFFFSQAAVATQTLQPTPKCREQKIYISSSTSNNSARVTNSLRN
jgi:hypothetical protein